MAKRMTDWALTKWLWIMARLSHVPASESIQRPDLLNVIHVVLLASKL